MRLLGQTPTRTYGKRLRRKRMRGNEEIRRRRKKRN
jgi:hypothetical protein